MLRRRGLPCALLALVAMAGCTKVNPSDLYGTWQVQARSQAGLPGALQSASSRIVLGPNGTFVASDMPAFFEFPGVQPARLESGRGTWKLAFREGRQRVLLNFEAIRNWKDDLPYTAELEVSEGSLFYYLGDPDDDQTVSFERR